MLIGIKLMIEKIRVALRKIIPLNLYRRISFLVDLSFVLKKLGFREGAKLLGPLRPDIIQSLIVPGYTREFYFRKSRTDISALIQNVLREEWRQGLPTSANAILDGGAYIGDTACFFRKLFPEAIIVAVEPNPENLCLLTKNFGHSEFDQIVHGAVWKKDEQLEFSGDTIFGSVSTTGGKQVESLKVKGFSIQSLLAEKGLKAFDIIKLDVEGAELEVLTSAYEWMTEAKVILVEFHGMEIERQCVNFLAKKGFDCRVYRSVHCFTRKL